jgi:hypothetical protein
MAACRAVPPTDEMHVEIVDAVRLASRCAEMHSVSDELFEALNLRPTPRSGEMHSRLEGIVARSVA